MWTFCLVQDILHLLTASWTKTVPFPWERALNSLKNLCKFFVVSLDLDAGAPEAMQCGQM